MDQELKTSTHYDEIMDMICHAARFKMALNSHKGDITLMPPTVAADLAKDEIDEIMGAVRDKNFEKIIIEAGDTLNFLLAIACRAVDDYRNRK
jgi:hypothetical protein